MRRWFPKLCLRLKEFHLKNNYPPIGKCMVAWSYTRQMTLIAANLFAEYSVSDSASQREHVFTACIIIFIVSDDDSKRVQILIKINKRSTSPPAVSDESFGRRLR